MAVDERGRKVTGANLPKSFSVGMSSGGVMPLTLEEQLEAAALKEEREAHDKKVADETRAHLQRIASQKVTRKLIPYGTRILVKRRKVEDKSSHIILPDEVKNLPTDVADVIEVPEQTFTDQKLIANAGAIIEALTIEACKRICGGCVYSRFSRLTTVPQR